MRIIYITAFLQIIIDLHYICTLLQNMTLHFIKSFNLSKKKIKERSNENLDPRVSRTKEFGDAICLGLLYIYSPKKKYR